MAAVIVPALVHGAWLCAWMTFVILGSLWHDPRIWQGDVSSGRERWSKPRYAGEQPTSRFPGA